MGTPGFPIPLRENCAPKPSYGQGRGETGFPSIALREPMFTFVCGGAAWTVNKIFPYNLAPSFA